MTTARRRSHLSLLAAADLEQLERDGHRPGLGRPSWVTIAADVGFWLLYGVLAVLIAYLAFWAPP